MNIQLRLVVQIAPVVIFLTRSLRALRGPFFSLAAEAPALIPEMALGSVFMPPEQP